MDQRKDPVIASTTFEALNLGWNADPNDPNPQLEWSGNDLKLKFYLNSFQYDEYNEGDIGIITFGNCSRCRLGNLNDEGWYRGESRFSCVKHKWGEFYEVNGDLLLNKDLGGWDVRVEDEIDRKHYILYMRDNDFECDALYWDLEILKA